MKSVQLELELGNFRLLQAIRKAEKNVARKRFFDFVKFNFRREKNESTTNRKKHTL